MINRRNIITGEIFHIINRGTDKRKIFLDDQDYFRFIHDLFEFNDINAAFNLGRFLKHSQLIDFRSQSIGKLRPRKLIVEILAFCLMPNHFHLLLKQKKDNGITKFMQKLGAGYANYFNQKYERTGHLFQGKFKAINVNRQEYLEYLSYYIHFNALDLIEPGWRKGKIKDYQKAISFLDTYRYSSHLDYAGKKNFPSVIQRDFLLNILNGGKNYKESVKKWLNEISKQEKTEEFKKIILE